MVSWIRWQEDAGEAMLQTSITEPAARSCDCKSVGAFGVVVAQVIEQINWKVGGLTLVCSSLDAKYS